MHSELGHGRGDDRDREPARHGTRPEHGGREDQRAEGVEQEAEHLGKHQVLRVRDRELEEARTVRTAAPSGP